MNLQPLLAISFLLLITKIHSDCQIALLNPTQYILNGDFEGPALGSTQTTRTAIPSDIPGWTSAKSQIGRGPHYNSRWGSTQVLDLAPTNENMLYHQFVNLMPGYKYQLQLQCAPRESEPLSTSGFKVKWNDVTVIDQSLPTDYDKIKYRILLTTGIVYNKLTLQGTGTADSYGTTCDNVKLYQVQTDYYRIFNNGDCDCMPGYYDIPPSLQCYTCSISLCQTCTSPTACTQCQWGYYFSNPTTCSTCSSILTNCLNCTMDGLTCYNCQSGLTVIGGQCRCADGYYYTSGSCQPCSSVDSLCLKCDIVSSQFVCLECQERYYASPSTCLSCAYIHSACLNCTGSGVCYECDTANNFDLNSNSCRCASGYFQNSTTQICQACSTLDSSCTLCSTVSGLTSCTSCLTGYYASVTNCLTCSTAEFGCLQCSNDGSTCTLCDSGGNFQESGGQCICSTGYYQNTTTQACQTCSILDPFCLTCSSPSGSYECSSCTWGFFPISHSCVLCSTGMSGCLNCSMDASVCYDCNQTANYFLSSTTCTLCSLIGCLNCSSLSTCQTCNESNNFFLNFTSQQCQVCVQQGCLNCSSLYNCYDDCDIANNYLFNNATNLCYLCTLEGCVRCLSNDTCQLCGEGYKAQPNADLQCDKVLGCADLMEGLSASTVNPAVPAIDYSLEQCQNAEKLQTLSNSIVYSSYGLLFVSMFCGKIIGLELFGVLQLAFFNLAENDYINLYLSPLLNWKMTNGFNLEPKNSGHAQNKTSNPYSSNRSLLQIDGTLIKTSSRNVLPLKIQQLGYTQSFIENINIMLIILLAQFVLSMACIGIGIKYKCCSKIGRVMLKQIFVTTLLFNCLNISFCLGLHFQYATQSNTGYYGYSTAAAVLAILFFAVAIATLTFFSSSSSSEFKNKFKRNWLTRAYIPLTIAYRFSLGFYIGFSNQQHYQSLPIMAVSFAFMLYNFVNLPFLQTYQNYRANLCHLTQLIILTVANFYTVMKSNDPMEVKFKIFSPAKLEIALIAFCVVVSGMCLFYDFYQYAREKCQRNYVINQHGNESQVCLQNTEGNEDRNQQRKSFDFREGVEMKIY